MFKNQRDLLAFLLAVIVIPAMWTLHGLGWMQLPETVIGATIMLETLIAQFYFRKANTAPPAAR